MLSTHFFSFNFGCLFSVLSWAEVNAFRFVIKNGECCPLIRGERLTFHAFRFCKREMSRLACPQFHTGQCYKESHVLLRRYMYIFCLKVQESKYRRNVYTLTVVTIEKKSQNDRLRRVR